METAPPGGDDCSSNWLPDGLLLQLRLVLLLQDAVVLLGPMGCFPLTVFKTDSISAYLFIHSFLCLFSSLVIHLFFQLFIHLLIFFSIVLSSLGRWRDPASGVGAPASTGGSVHCMQ